MQNYPNYPYYGQPQHSGYPQPSYNNAPPPNGYPSYGYPGYPAQNSNGATTPFIPPLSTYDAPSAAQNIQPASQSRKKHHKQQLAAPSNAAPLKSAMKRAGNTPGFATQNLPASEDHSKRKRVNSTAKEGVGPLSRIRSNPNRSIADFQSIHVFLSFVGHSEVHLEHMAEPAQEEIRNTIFKPWVAGIEVEERKGFLWRVRLRDTPWDMSGTRSTEAFDLIVRLFTLFARRGYTFQAMTKAAAPYPRLIFVTAEVDSQSQFFLGYFSNRDRRITLIRPPPVIGALGQAMQQILADQIDDQVVAGNRVFELKPSFSAYGAPPIEPAFFALIVLKSISDLGFQLEATILMAPKISIGPLAFGSRREILVFKGTPTPRHGY
ncbi:hypothetical protein C8J56DRAFT_305150 [Mycena floridula]|nr:hypothetical protein C8J56DRAFT_305150 [Mycena floridula]